MMIWILIGSLVCTLFYSLATYDYMRNHIMWEEALFPGMLIWNKLGETNINVVVKVILTAVASIALFTYTLLAFSVCIIALCAIAIWELIKYIFS